MKPLVLGLVLAAGGLVSVQVAVNARLALGIGSAFGAAMVSSIVGALALAPVVVLTSRSGPSPHAAAVVPWWAWIGGLCGASYLTVLAFSLPRLGAATSLALAVAGQLLVAALIDQFGLFGLERQTPGLLRLVGIGLVLCGATALALAQPQS